MGWTNIKYALADHSLVDQEIRLTKMDWTLVRAVRLEFDDPKQKHKQNPTDSKTETKKHARTLGSDGQGMSVSDSINVATVASFLVKVAVEGLFVKEAVVVAE